ncbi:hypothetical protein [Oceanobacillus jeddahense]|uniref:EF-hand domain-containing protein n=1 Tax=Oceanobacillus jeddahense TaxID=1462527 RepID=A0ABY5JP54_9BACI|nr:hypothetical protein [Oceanobacillus jeddahense]UUI02091.1 hypothetical protein NP439_18900 [Oceanobacillus jeddahense]
MIINKGGDLSKEYFMGYFSLLMNSRQCTLEKAKEITFDRLFRNDENTFGNISFEHFIEAYEELKE